MPKITSMPTECYNITKWTIRDYDRRVKQLEQMRRDVESLKAASIDGMPKGEAAPGLDDKIAAMVDLENEVEKIQSCIDTIPPDMRDGIMNNIIKGNDYPRNAYGNYVPSKRTWKRAKKKFMILVAKELHIYGHYQ